jgi:hypothetical protein
MQRNLPPIACCIFADSVRAETSQAGVADIRLAIAARAGATTADSVGRTETVDARRWFLAWRGRATRPSLAATKLSACSSVITRILRP